MHQGFSRRNFLSMLAVTAAGAGLSACTDSDEASGDPKPTTGTAQTPAAAAQTPAAPPAAAAPEPVGTVDMATLLRPGPLPEMMLGKMDAPVTIVEYASATCSHCAHFSETTMPALKTKYIDTGRVRLIFREFPFDPRAKAAFMLARCSGDKYFAMLEVLFRQQEGWAAVEDAKAALLQLSKLAGFTQESFEACLTDQKLADNIEAVRNRGETEFEINSTPTFFINGKKYIGALSIESMSAIIDGIK